MNVAENLASIRENIEQACRKSGRDPQEVSVIAVTKYVSVETANQAIQAGIKNIGENRKEGFLEKYNEIGSEATWHFIGTLQSRKVKDVINQMDYLHSLDRLSLAKEVNKRAPHKINCFVQVNVSGEDSKHGINPEEVIPFVEKLGNYEQIEVSGLMTMAPHTENEDLLRGCFQNLRKLKEQIQDLRLSHAPCNYLSMGMSNDYSIAVEEGATHIRIGTKLVGKEF
ncbi:YggS family pyridoxal phosphate-dependent enzyme [Virgibacillus sp. MSP4-1]|uniref:YggS family pyridoxal phosphate-dependent enzyme n=1 Tax=Virgibacillus sp. MSP4-1 TaxID=2700081 RepID=UPI0003A3B59B|nr:YggS family pyridoxal phosphate-dependent enzyme [Virgibacillus sp. MSP4-1]QHS22180.1 YggS family pyridoxal phosphate-dependent enzyme [Virgibacillus sp. MSP4-1]